MTIRYRSFIEGMELAMRICRNRSMDAASINEPVRSQEAELCAAIIRSVQVQIGAGRQPFPIFTVDETDEIERIS